MPEADKKKLVLKWLVKFVFFLIFFLMQRYNLLHGLVSIQLTGLVIEPIPKSYSGHKMTGSLSMIDGQ